MCGSQLVSGELERLAVAGRQSGLPGQLQAAVCGRWVAHVGHHKAGHGGKAGNGG